jgi:uncharacterized phage infection (PIP) family protein YhgE
VADVVAEIATASQEQASGIEQVNKAVMQMDEGTQQNAALVEQAAAASESIVTQATQLAALVARYDVADTAGGPARTAAAAPRTRTTVKPKASPAAERRSAKRPWTQSTKTPGSAAPAALKKSATGGGDDWQEF